MLPQEGTVASVTQCSECYGVVQVDPQIWALEGRRKAEEREEVPVPLSYKAGNRELHQQLLLE